MNTKKQQSNYLNMGLWIVQFILGLSLISGGIVKFYLTPGQLAEMWPWTADTGCLVHKTAVLDLLAGIGLVLPTLLRYYTIFTVYAALGTVLLMFGAIIMHVSRGEVADIGINIVFVLLALFIAWGRYYKVPIFGRR